jgi:N-acetylglucosaminyldiphosphoundecaprenol N-acetyl-beta-D-mannosaminyltransferase
MSDLESEPPQFSVIVPVRGRRDLLARCLSSLAMQEAPPPFEVVVVDDGSDPWLDIGPREDLRIRVVKQVHLGVASARNRGVATSFPRSDIVFIDSDCEAHRGMLRELACKMECHPEDSAFQLHLRSRSTTTVESLEGLRIAAIQEATSTRDGRVLYLNTSGCALRRTFLDTHRLAFDPGAIRGEDTLLLAELLRRGQAPRFVSDARVEHRPALPVTRYVLKHFLVGYRTNEARRALTETGNVLLSIERRRSMLRSIAARAKGMPRAKRIVSLLMAAYGLEQLGRLAERAFGMVRRRQEVLDVHVDPVRRTELIARILDAAEKRVSLRVTYLTAWTLVQARVDRAFACLLRTFDIVYADGMGVVWTLLLTRLRRCKKVTAGDFFFALCQEAAQRRLRLALVGARESTNAAAVRKLTEKIPHLDVVYRHQGYVSLPGDEQVLDDLAGASPDLVVLGMGQPLQERWAVAVQARMRATVYCVGGLFEQIAGEAATPPRWIRRVGLEWMHRLAARPSRYWRRYLIGLPALVLIGLVDVGSRVGRITKAKGQPSSTGTHQQG